MMRTRARSALVAAALLLSCGTRVEYPWGTSVDRVPSESGDVRTLNTGYQRAHSQVLVREVLRPTRAALDYAAYHANFMIADPAPETSFDATSPPDTSHPFAGVLDKSTLTSDVRKTALTESERKKPM